MGRFVGVKKERYKRGIKESSAAGFGVYKCLLHDVGLMKMTKKLCFVLFVYCFKFGLFYIFICLYVSNQLHCLNVHF